MSYESPDKRLAFLQKEVFDPNSDIYIENLLDLAASVTYDIHSSGTFKNSKPIKAFLERYSNFSDKAYKYRVSLSDFEIKKTIGQGGFGRVDLVKHKVTKDVYAMKVIEKTTYIQNAFNGFWEERDILAMNSSDWLVKCFYSFMDLKKLYIIMEYMPGGNLYHWLSVLEEFNEEQTHFYALEMILAVETLHNMHYLHRDLKPDNMLLDKNGHLKLADFGTCIKVNQGKVKTNFQVGTPDYIAPEVLRNAGVHDLEVGFEIDWWAFGIVIFELFYGETPFEGESTATLYKNIMCYKNTLCYPDDKTASDDFIGFLKKILTEPTERMTIGAIKTHTYVCKSGYRWNLDNINQIPSPLIFSVTGGDDTQYITFDPTEKRSNITGAFTNNNFFSGENLAFTGFTFNRYHRYGLGDSGVKSDTVDTLKMSELQAKLSEVELARQQLTIKLEKNDAELKQILMKLSSAEKELSDKEQMLSTKKNETNQNSEANKQLKMKMESLNNQYELSQRELDRLKSLIEDKDIQIRNMKLEVSNSSQNINNLKTSLQQVEQKLSEANADLEDRANHIENLTKFESLLVEEQNNVKNLSSDINAKNRKIVEYEKHFEQLQNEIVDLRSNYNNVKDAKINNNEKKEELTDMREKYDKVQREKQAVESQVCLLHDDLKDMKLERDSLRSELRIETLKKTALDKTKDKLSKELAEKKLQFNGMQNRVYETEDQMKVLKQRVNVIENEREQLDLQCKMYHKMSILKRTELNEAQEELNELREKYEDTVNQLKMEKMELEKRMAKLTSELEEMKIECNDHRSKLGLMDSMTLEGRNLVDKMKIDIDERKTEIESLLETQLQNDIKIERYESQSKIDKAKIDSIVMKLNELISNPASAQQYQPRKKKEANNTSSKRVKELERDIANYKTRAEDYIREITEAKNECQSWREKTKELEQENEKKIATINHLLSKVSDTVVQDVHSDEGVFKNSVLSTRLEGRIEMFKKGKGRHKINWIPSFAVLQPYRLDIYQNENDTAPLQTLDLRSIMHVKETTQVDCVHIDKILLPQMLSIIYSKPDGDEMVSGSGNSSRRISMMPPPLAVGGAAGASLTAGDFNRRSKNSTLSIDETSSMHASNPDLTGVIYLNNHSFVHMRFRSSQVCESCHESCSDVFNPPLSVECSKCKRRFHLGHITEKTPACIDAIEVLLIKLETSESKIAWRLRFNQLKQYQKENEVSIAPNTFYRSVRQPSNLQLITNHGQMPPSS